jgi:glucokinase
MHNKFIIGIDLGGTNLKIALFDLEYKIKSKLILTTKRFFKKEDLILAITNSVDKILRDNKLNKSQVLGLGIGLPGPIDKKSGIVRFLPNIPGWKEVNLKKILQQKLKIPVVLDNDAKMMCLAESRMGAAFGVRNALCLTLGTGVGGSLIINGQLYRGMDNASGEIGHMPINEVGPKCSCGGIACLESYIGNNRIMEQARKVFKRRIALEELSSMAKKGNKQALKIWDQMGFRLGVALSGIVNLLNLDVIVIGGGVSNAGRILFDPIRKTINDRSMSVQTRRLKLFKAKLGSDAGLIGSAMLVKEELSKNR